MKKIVLLLVIAAFMVAGIFSPAVSAAGTADGKEILDKNYVLLGESGLNFSSFSLGGTYSRMIYMSSIGIPIGQFDISDSVNIPADLSEGRYYAYTADMQFTSGKYCIITSGKTLPYAFYDSTGKNELGKNQVDAEAGKDFTFVFKGKPGVQYQIFQDNAIKFNDYLDRSTLSKEITITLPSTIGTIDIKAVPAAGSLVNDGEISFTINVVEKLDDTTILRINTPSSDALSGLFAVGDMIYISGTLSPSLSSDNKPVYLYVKGVNLPYSGVNLEGEPVVDGDESSFTTTTYYASLNSWTAEWDTSEFERGTYTVYASLYPLGYSEERLMGGGEAIKSQEYTLSDRSIHVKFAEENNGIFTQGDYLYAYWSARGSPAQVRWYIIGQNYMETKQTSFPLYTADQKKGYDVPQGVYGFSYDRLHTQDMAAGSYYLLYQHPGSNGVFDVNPDNTDGYFSALSTTFGESSSLSGRPSSNCAEVLTRLIDNIKCDDLYVIEYITIEEPEINIDQVANLAIGDKLKIKGTTNYAGSGFTVDGTDVKDTLSLKINRINFDIPEENAAMKLEIVPRVIPQNVDPEKGEYFGERTYEFAEIDTSTWFEGTYQAVVTNTNTGFENYIMFTVGGEGVEADSSTLQVPADPLADPDTTLEPLPPIVDYSVPTEPVAPESPGFLLAPFALGAAIALRRK